jgi:hypothetical protein
MKESAPLLPSWFVKAQNIAKPISIGFLTAIGFVMYMPGVKQSLTVRVPIGDGYINLYDLLLIVLILCALPFIILAGNSINLQSFIKKP